MSYGSKDTEDLDENSKLQFHLKNSVARQSDTENRGQNTEL